MDVLIVVDVLKDFLEEGGALFCGDNSRKIIPVIKEKIEEFHSSGNTIIYVSDAHAPDDPEFQRFKQHAVKGSSGAEIIHELRPSESDVVIEKTHLDCFYNTDLGEILDEISPETVYLAGVCTSICIMDASGGLKSRGYNVAIYKDGVADFDLEAHEAALKRMKSIYGVEIV